MALGFLGSIASGIGKGISGIGRGIRKVPSILDGDGDGGDLPLTPGFNPAARMPKLRRPNPFGAQDLVNRPGDAAEAQLIDMRRPGRDGIWERPPEIGADRPSPLALPARVRPRPFERPSPLTENIDPGSPAPIAAQPGSPTFRKQSPYEEVQSARAAYDQAYVPPQGFGERLKRAALPAIGGLLQGAATGDSGRAIGGLIGGAGMGLFAPKQVYQAEFDRRIKPQILERQAAEEKEEGRARALEDRERAWQKDQAEIARERAQTAGMPSAEEAKAAREADLRLKAEQTKQAGYKGVRSEQIQELDGSISTYNVYADGTRVLIGRSGKAAIEQNKIGSREKVAGMQESGRNARAAASQAGIDRRSATKKGIKTVTDGDIDDAMNEPANKGLNREQVIEIFRKSGFITKGLRRY